MVTTRPALKSEKANLCMALGADEVIDYKSMKFDEVLGKSDESKFDVCFDTTGESIFLLFFELVKYYISTGEV